MAANPLSLPPQLSLPSSDSPSVLCTSGSEFPASTPESALPVVLPTLCVMPSQAQELLPGVPFVLSVIEPLARVHD